MNIAICPGSFDPITLGHIDVIKRTAKIFDKVIVVAMDNPAKTTSAFTEEEKQDFIKRSVKGIPNVEVDSYNGLLAEYVKIKGAVAVVKGLRAVSDFEYEFQQALINRKLNPEVETMFLSASPEHMFLSSSLVKNVCSYGGDITGMVPEEIKNDIINKINRKG